MLLTVDILLQKSGRVSKTRLTTNYGGAKDGTEGSRLY